jgi:hypothetical protein
LVLRASAKENAMSQSPRIMLLALSSLVLACSSSGNGESTPEDTGVGDVGVDTEVDALAAGEQACFDGWAINCKQFAKCAPVAFQRWFESEADCAKGYAVGCKENFVDPYSSWTVDQARKCVTAVSSYYGDTCQKWIRQFWGRTNTAIKDVLPDCWTPGTLATGAACTLAQDCQSGYCDLVYGKSCGTCRDRIAQGAVCNAAKYTACISGTTCAAAKCVAFGEVGADCLTSDSCHTDLACLSGKCAPRLSVGDVCDPARGSSECGVTQKCNAKTMRCELWTLAKDGQPCGDVDSGGFALCERGLACKVVDTATGAATCAPRAKIGEACSFNGPLETQCEWPSVCVNKSCTRLAWNSCG